jgi:hypothetical protein
MKPLLAIVLSIILVAISILLVVFDCGSSLFRSQRNPASKTELRLIEFDSNELDAGKHPQDFESKSFSFTFRNNTAHSVILESVEADCSCTKPSFDRMIPAGQKSRIEIGIKPSLRKRTYSMRVRARQNGIEQLEVLTVNLEVFDPDSTLVTPTSILLGDLIFGEPFRVERELRIATNDGQPVVPLSMSGPDWLKVDYRPLGECLLLTLSGRLPKNRDSVRGRIQISLASPNKNQSVEFQYIPHEKYEITPRRLFGIIGEGHDARHVTLSGVQNESVSFTVTMEGTGTIEVKQGDDPTQFLVTPVLSEECEELSGRIIWVVRSVEGRHIEDLESTFFFSKIRKRGKN